MAKPPRRPLGRTRDAERSASYSPRRAARSAWTPSTSRTAAPTTRSTVYATWEVATSAASPAPAARTQRYSPVSSPKTTGTPARNPPSEQRRISSATAGPGTAEISSTAPTNAGSCRNSSMPGFSAGALPVSDPVIDDGGQDRHGDVAVVEQRAVEGGQVEALTERGAGLAAQPQDLPLTDQVGERLTRPRDVAVDLVGEEALRERDVLHQVIPRPLPAPAQGVQSGVDDEPGRAVQLDVDRADLGLDAAVEPELAGQPLGVEPPALGMDGHRELLQQWQVGQLLQPGQLRMVPGHGLVERHRLEVPAGAGG